jgi:hypothetical protein
MKTTFIAGGDGPMTACAVETATDHGKASENGREKGNERGNGNGNGIRSFGGNAAFAMTADGSYAARLTLRKGQADAGDGGGGHGGEGGEDGDGDGDAWFPERWTLGGPEPYAVPLPLDQPEEPDTDVLPLTDGRVLIRRRVADRHDFSLLYPIGPGTGQLSVGAVECPLLTLLSPSPDGRHAYALSVGPHSTTVWLVAGGSFGPERVAEVPGRCSGGVWLDRTGRMLALDRETDGVIKAVAVDLARGGEVTPLLQITDESNDRLLLADPDSGLLLIRSDAPGHDRLGWGVLGSRSPMRFPACLRSPDHTVTPFAVQPGQSLMPESCAVALRIDGPAGSRLGVWRPAGRQLHQRPAPPGWLAGAGVWTRDGVLRLPYATGAVPCGVAGLVAPVDTPRPRPRSAVAMAVSTAVRGTTVGSTGDGVPAAGATAPAPAKSPGRKPSGAPRTPVMRRPVPLQRAPLTGLGVPG